MGWALFFLNGLIFSSKQLRNLNVFVYICGKNHRMKPSEFVNKFKSRYLWGNLAAMVVVGVLLCIAVKYCYAEQYTHHDHSCEILLGCVYASWRSNCGAGCAQQTLCRC